MPSNFKHYIAIYKKNCALFLLNYDSDCRYVCMFFCVQKYIQMNTFIKIRSIQYEINGLTYVKLIFVSHTLNSNWAIQLIKMKRSEFWDDFDTFPQPQNGIKILKEKQLMQLCCFFGYHTNFKWRNYTM